MSAQAQDLKERQFGLLSDLFPTPTKSNGRTSSASSAHSTSATSTTTTSSSTSTTSSSSSSSSTTSSPPDVVTTVAGQTITLTATAAGQTPTISSSSPAPTFLQNKVLSGVVFGLVGLLGLIFLIAITTCLVRRRRNKKLLEEAARFDPVSVSNYDDHKLLTGTMEKPRRSSSAGYETDAVLYNPRPYPIPYMYPTTAPHGEVGQFQSSSAWSNPVQRHVAY